MRRYKPFKEEDKHKIITIECRDDYNNLEKLLHEIKVLGNIGHTFNIIVDPKSENESTFEWDGDGPDHIFDIKVS